MDQSQRHNTVYTLTDLAEHFIAGNKHSGRGLGLSFPINVLVCSLRTRWRMTLDKVTFSPLASRPPPVAFVPLLPLKCSLRCHEGFIHRWESVWWIVVGDSASAFLSVQLSLSVVGECKSQMILRGRAVCASHIVDKLTTGWQQLKYCQFPNIFLQLFFHLTN